MAIYWPLQSSFSSPPLGLPDAPPGSPNIRVGAFFEALRSLLHESAPQYPSPPPAPPSP